MGTNIHLNRSKYVVALTNKGTALWGLGQHQEALIWADKALEIVSDNAKAL
ncbi:MAG: tetratricopeptide repeat protein [Thermoproteota archaeon]|nr:tetratricopeptide repeat protein [Thermoproteota archaeon]